MARSNIVNLPIRHPAIGKDDALWMIAVRSGLKDKYSCEYDTEKSQWYLKVQSSTFQGSEALIAKCLHNLGWDSPVDGISVAK